VPRPRSLVATGLPSLPRRQIFSASDHFEPFDPSNGRRETTRQESERSILGA
jgi:hypothetical protein